MADTIETLEIEVKHSATGAADELNRVVTAVRNLSKALGTCLPRMVEFNEALRGFKGNIALVDVHGNNVSNTFNKVSTATGKASSGFKDLSKQASKAKGPLENLVSSLKRIAFYRVIRSVIKAIGKAFKEGSEDAYFFSQSITTAGHRFAAALDNMSTKSLTMKNQLGAAWNALLTLISPIINALIDLVTRFANAMTQLLSVFTGGTYLKAVDYPAQWAENANKAGKAAKEWKNQLLGFDEINRLEEPSNGGGSGKTEADPTKMFQDTEIDGIFKKLKNRVDELRNSLDFGPLKKSWEELKKSVGELVDLIVEGLGWAWDNILEPMTHWTIEKLSPTFFTLLSAAIGLFSAALVFLKPYAKWFWENFLKPLAEYVGDTIIWFIENLTAVIKGLTEVLKGDKSFSEFLETLNGVQTAMLAFLALLLGATISGIFKGVGNLITSFLSTPLGKLIVIIILAKYAFDKVTEAINLFNEEGKVTPEIIGKIMEALGAVVIVIGLFTSPWVIAAGVIVWAIGWVLTHLEEIKDWLQKNHPNLYWFCVNAADWFREAKDSISTTLDELGFSFGSALGSIGLLILGFIVGGPWGLLVSAIAVGVSWIIRNWDKIQAWCDEHIPSIEEAWQWLKDNFATIVTGIALGVTAILLGPWGWLVVAVVAGVAAIVKNWDKIVAWVEEKCPWISKAWETVKDNLDLIVGAIGVLFAGLLFGPWGALVAGIVLGVTWIIQNWGMLKEKIIAVVEKIKAKWDELKAKWDEKLEPLKTAIADWKNSWVTAFNAVCAVVSKLFGWIMVAWSAFKGFISDLAANPIGNAWTEDNTFTSPTDGRTIKMPGMNGAASGGIFSTGEIFVAREAGPEMVGTIGNRTAVANNDQIVEGIREGVFEAVSAAMSSSSSNGRQDIHVYLDSREIRAGQQRLNRAWGV